MAGEKERPSDSRIYTHRLGEGTPVWRNPESEVEEVTVFTSLPWIVHVRGADRRGVESVRALIGGIIGAPEDQGFKPGDTVYVSQGALTKRTTEKRLLDEIDKTLNVTHIVVQPVEKQVFLPGFERKPHEQGISDFTDLKNK